VVDVQAVRAGARWHNRYELVWQRVFDRMLANADEIVAAVTAVARGDNPFTHAAIAR